MQEAARRCDVRSKASGPGVALKNRMKKMPIDIITVDDHFLVREGVKAMLSGSGISVVGQAADGDEAVRVARKHRPDVVLLDVAMPGRDGIDAIEKIKKAAPQTRIVLFSNYASPTYAARGFAYGAVDYVLKGSSRDDLVASIRGALNEDPPRGEIAQAVRESLGRDSLNGDGPRSGAVAKKLDRLTVRESQVLRHLAHGLSNREIGHSLKISVETVKEHVQHLFRKLEVGDRTEAAVWAVKSGLA